MREELGVKVLLEEARAIFAAAGCRVEDDMVFIGRNIVETSIASAPKSIRLRAINPEHKQIYELGSLVFTPAGDAPTCITPAMVASRGLWRDIKMLRN